MDCIYIGLRGTYKDVMQKRSPECLDDYEEPYEDIMHKCNVHLD
jgi:hypothetical protein